MVINLLLPSIWAWLNELKPQGKLGRRDVMDIARRILHCAVNHCTEGYVDDGLRVLPGKGAFPIILMVSAVSSPSSVYYLFMAVAQNEPPQPLVRNLELVHVSSTLEPQDYEEATRKLASR